VGNEQQSSSLVLTLEVQEPVVVGLSALGTLRVTNRATTPITISSRLNLMEGDVRLIVEGPDGTRRELHGWQADTILNEVTLGPNEQLVANLNLLQTEEGPVFPTSGRYQLQAEFSPSLQSPAIKSQPVVVNVRAPQTDAERGAAQLLRDDNVRRSIVLAQSDASPGELTSAIRKEIHAVDPDLPLHNVKSMSERVEESLARQRFSMSLLTLFAGFAMVLAIVGIYGVLAFLVRQGSREIGIRMSLGATQAGILRLIVGRGLRIATLGVGIGLLGAFLLTRFLESILYDVRATDPWTFGGIALLLLMVALIASYVPARRAARIDPMLTLRDE